jgi:hypothetical protein
MSIRHLDQFMPRYSPRKEKRALLRGATSVSQPSCFSWHFIIVYGGGDQIDIAGKGTISMFSLATDILATEAAAPSIL